MRFSGGAQLDGNRRQRSRRCVNANWTLLCAALVCGVFADHTAVPHDAARGQLHQQSVMKAEQEPGRCGRLACLNGECIDGKCTCYAGWQGANCQLCGGRVRLTEQAGVITHGVGNYSTDMQCTWLIDATASGGGSGGANRSVQLYLDEFVTECGWDYVYIFDGDNVYDNLLAVYSGVVRTAGVGLPVLEAHSGSVYVHFFSDAAFNMTGFRIRYKYSACASINDSSDGSCSGHGVCRASVGSSALASGTAACSCRAGWHGAACHLADCPANCGNHGACHAGRRRCVCQPGYTGVDCSQREHLSHWSTVHTVGYAPPGRASHAAVVKGDAVYLLGGEMFVDGDFVVKYDINGGVWEPYHTRSAMQPSRRYGHSAVLRGDNIYMYGGALSHGVAGVRGGVRGGNGGVSGELWALDTSTRHWERLHVKPHGCLRRVCGPLPTAGHTAVITDDDRMLVLFGHSPVYGYLNYVQIYHFGTGMWSVVGTGGALVKGGYGHSSVWHAELRRVLVYGGHVSDTVAAYSATPLLHALHVDTMTWSRLSASGVAQFLHASVLVHADSVMLVIGGNVHNDTAATTANTAAASIGDFAGGGSGSTQCHRRALLAYDVRCDRWRPLRPPPTARWTAAPSVERYGHSAAVYAGAVYVLGGFNGRMLSDVVRFTPGACAAFGGSQRRCVYDSLSAGVKCAWHRQQRICQPLALASEQTHAICEIDDDVTIHSNMTSHVVDEQNLSLSTFATRHCASISSCATCVNSLHNCVWCGVQCMHRHCSDLSTSAAALDQCHPGFASNCTLMHNCHACHSEAHCKWELDHKCYTLVETTHRNDTALATAVVQEPCGRSCSERNSCHNCTSANCMWCINQMRCVDNNAYVVSFPYGECMEWTTLESKCQTIPAGGGSCEAHKTCQRCQQDPGCGWCDSGSGTGLGRCLAGGYSGALNTTQCTAKLWNFLSCPPCQCNGHSTCYPGNSTCQPCGDLTSGQHCDTCQRGYYGDPVNGGHCQPCNCNNHGTGCEPRSGKCYCDTKGLVGDRCDRCDSLNKFAGDPSSGQQCYYKLLLDFQFTFNLTKPEDMHYRQINFFNRPLHANVNTDFHITCSVPAKLNITVKSAGDKVGRSLLADFNCTHYEHRFSSAEFVFGVPDNTTFYVHVYRLQPPLFVQVAFTQHSGLDLRQFFITFSSCFLLLLVIAALLWKVKQKIDSYRRRQRFVVEMEQMASRAYAQVNVVLDPRSGHAFSQLGQPDDSCLSLPPYSFRSQSVPTAIALEHCSDNRAALLTVIIQCPTGGGAYTPAGTSGILTGTALVADGSSRKSSGGACDALLKTDKRKSAAAAASNADPCV